MRNTSKERELTPLGDNFEGSEKLLGLGLWPTMAILTVCFLLGFASLVIGFGLGALLLGGAWRLSRKNPRWLEAWVASLSYYAVYAPGQTRSRWESRWAHTKRRLRWFGQS